MKFRTEESGPSQIGKENSPCYKICNYIEEKLHMKMSAQSWKALVYLRLTLLRYSKIERFNAVT